MFSGRPDDGDHRRATERLDARSRDGELFERLDGNRVRCLACAHRCELDPGQRGVCQMRVNRDGVLKVPAGYVAGLAVDPIEKKPLFHVLPGCDALSFGMLGCNLKCDFCQNWSTSQTLRDPSSIAEFREMTAQQIVDTATAQGAPVIASTYNEPVITSEWASEIMALGRKSGLRGAFVSNGLASAEALEFLRPALDVYKVDLKTFQDDNYRRLGGRLAPVLETIERAWELGYWVEVVTLVIPDFNDSNAELREMAAFIASVSVDVPWHVTAFHPAYKGSTGARPTSPDDIARAAQAGVDAGLRYVYAGNLRGALAELENTRCPSCRATLIGRSGYTVRENRISASGKCPDCDEAIAGIWQTATP